MADHLPIEQVIPDIRRALETGRCAVVQAPPGAGKTTLVPLALLEAPWLNGQNIVMLEPRRLAVRASANRMADLLKESVGHTVGYHIRMERRAGPQTRIEVVTEGILTRRIQADPSLKGTGLVIFDEFHERNLNSDLGLALCLEIREALRDDLRILVMSATLDAAPVSELMGNAPMIESVGKSWPVDTRYLPMRRDSRDAGAVERACAGAIRQALSEAAGDMLVFLPGAGEIRRVRSLLCNAVPMDHVSVLPLYGNLSAKEQDAAIAPSVPGHRKVVLATSIAETSLTIDGIRIVIDSGLMRIPRFFPGTGMSRLETVPVSRASADQRKGRAGRTAPGICYRLWPQESHPMLRAFNSPEILSTDLARLALELAVWGVSNPTDLKWLDPPPEGAFTQARALLKSLGALSPDGAITSHGKKLAALGIHPRFGHMILKAKQTGAGALACRIAALMGERDVLSFADGLRNADIRLRLEMIDAVIHKKAPDMQGVSVNRAGILAIIKNERKLENDLGIRPEKIDIGQAGELLALAFPERIAMARPGQNGEYRMASGSGAFFDETGSFSSEKFIVAADLDGNRKNARIYLAAAYTEKALERDFGHLLETRETVAWDKAAGAVVAIKERIYGQLVLKEAPLADPDPEAIAAEMMRGIRQRGIDCLPWDKKLRHWQARVVFLKKNGGFLDLPDLTDTALCLSLESWLRPFLSGISSASHLKQIDLKYALQSMLTWEQQQLIEQQAPTHLTVPSGSRIPLDYGELSAGPVGSPILAVRLQEMFGLEQTPRIAGGRIPVTLHLLSPAGRPVQVTCDLKSFWKNTYPDVKKDLKGRYPKHYWPDDPYTAEPTNRTRPGGR